MRKIFLALLCLSVSMALRAQQSLIVEDTATVEHQRNKSIILAPSYSFSRFAKTVTASFVTFTGGISFNDHAELGLQVSFNIDNFEKQVIFPQDYRYGQTNMSLYGDYAFFESKVRPLAGVAVSYALAEWTANVGGDEKFTDRIFILTPYVGAVWILNDFISVRAKGGYHFPGEVELISFGKEDFQGFTGDIGIKIRVLKF